MTYLRYTYLVHIDTKLGTCVSWHMCTWACKICQRCMYNVRALQMTGGINMPMLHVQCEGNSNDRWYTVRMWRMCTQVCSVSHCYMANVRMKSKSRVICSQGQKWPRGKSMKCHVLKRSKGKKSTQSKTVKRKQDANTERKASETRKA